MTTIKNLDYKTIIIAILAVIILLLNTCEPSPKPGETIYVKGEPYEVIKTEIDTFVKTVKQVVYKPGKTIYKEPTVYPSDSICYQNLDSVARSYYAMNIYKDTLKLEENLGYITVTDTIRQNELQGRVWKSFVNKVIVKEKVFVKQAPRTQVYIGAVAGFDRVKAVNFVGPSLLLKTKKDHIYSLSVGLSPNNIVAVQAGLYWKIKLRK